MLGMGVCDTDVAAFFIPAASYRRGKLRCDVFFVHLAHSNKVVACTIRDIYKLSINDTIRSLYNSNHRTAIYTHHIVDSKN